MAGSSAGIKALFNQLGQTAGGGGGTDPTKMPLAGGTFVGAVSFSLGTRTARWLEASGDFSSNARLVYFENTSTDTDSTIGLELLAGSGLGSRVVDCAPEYTVVAEYTGRFVQENYNDGFAWHAIEPTADYRWYIDSVEVMRIGADGVLYVNGVAVGTGGSGTVAPLQVDFDNGTNVIPAGSYADVYVGEERVLENWTILNDQAGSIEYALWLDTYGNYPPTDADKISGSVTQPKTTAASKGQQLSLTGWTTLTLPAGSTLRVSVVSCSGICKSKLTMKVTA